MARPSPSWPAHTPNWWPLYTVAKGRGPAMGMLPVSAASVSPDSCQPGGRPSSRATASLRPTQ
ncbi:Uncharacterised protein [Mycobacterium tuberculosis]|nr:Uncharacterised protein [Mycobacterium tuberculosis]